MPPQPHNALQNLPDSAGVPRAPDLFVMGAEKCGTTWLWKMLRMHPDIGVPIPKELRFFSSQYLGTGFDNFTAFQDLMSGQNRIENSADYAQKLANELRIIYGTENAYLRIFGQFKTRLVGDFTPQNCMLPNAGLRHLKSVAPKAKLVILLRDPVARLLSAARMKAQTDSEESLRKIALVPFQIRISQYSTWLEKLEAHFQGSQIFIGFLDDIKSQPRQFLQELCHFLDVSYDPQFFTFNGHIPNQSPTKSAAETLKTELYNILADEYDRLDQRFPNRTAQWRKSYFN